MSELQWMNEYNKIRTQLMQVTNSSLLPSKSMHLDSVRTSLTTLSDQLKVMEAKPEEHGMTRAKLLRKRGLIENLQRQLSSLSKEEGVETGTKSDNISSISSRLALQKSTMQEHERIMAQLGEGVGRLHQTSVNINTEANMHLRLLDGMEDNMDKANEGLLQETKRAARVRQKGKTFWLYVTIVILIIILVLLIVSGL